MIRRSLPSSAVCHGREETGGKKREGQEFLVSVWKRPSPISPPHHPLTKTSKVAGQSFSPKQQLGGGGPHILQPPSSWPLPGGTSSPGSNSESGSSLGRVESFCRNVTVPHSFLGTPRAFRGPWELGEPHTAGFHCYSHGVSLGQGQNGPPECEAVGGEFVLRCFRCL